MKRLVWLAFLGVAHATRFVGSFTRGSSNAERAAAGAACVAAGCSEWSSRPGSRIFTFEAPTSLDGWSFTYSNTVQHVGVDVVMRTQTCSRSAFSPGGTPLRALDSLDGTVDGVYNPPVCPTTPVHLFMLDTGLYPHQDFGNRISADSHCALSTAACANNTPPWLDIYGHGTATTGLVTGSITGVYPWCTIHAVKVLGDDGSGSSSGVAAGVEWVLDYVTSNAIPRSVLSASLGGAYSLFLNAYFDELTLAGVIPVVAAGNSAANACGSSPASSPSVITVGAVDSTNTMASFSDFGPCVDVYTQGVNVVSTSHGLPGNLYEFASGTSLATPLVSGAVAMYLATNGVCARPSNANIAGGPVALGVPGGGAHTLLLSTLFGPNVTCQGYTQKSNPAPPTSSTSSSTSFNPLGWGVPCTPPSCSVVSGVESCLNCPLGLYESSIPSIGVCNAMCVCAGVGQPAALEAGVRGACCTGLVPGPEGTCGVGVLVNVSQATTALRYPLTPTSTTGNAVAATVGTGTGTLFGTWWFDPRARSRLMEHPAC